ncbi:MAG: NUDIX domain-containing protein [Dehalococcoidales bacterium]|nr:MAG: NUDIX domain-containing protein [Dehalococcoidales bacterium]
MSYQNLMAHDGEEFSFHADGQDWIASWHSPDFEAPEGKMHGSAAVCITDDDNIVLVSSDGQYWDFPGGRPNGNENWRETLEREVLEEACAIVEDAELLGFSKGICVKGLEEGLVLVRSLWRAAVSLRDWYPKHEIKQRYLVPSDTALAWVLEQGRFPDGLQPIYLRWFYEALNTP